MTNDDILRLLSAGLGEETVVMLIQNSESEFDTSANALSKLVEAKVPETVIQAMISGRKIHPDRIIEIQVNRMEDQSKAPDEFVLYRISPKTPLAPGEYALVLNNQEIRVSGFLPTAV